MDSVRIDRWLCAARIFKSRSLAQQACDAGHVRLNDQTVKSSHVVRVGETVLVATRQGKRTLLVVELEEKRQSPSRARELFAEPNPIEHDDSMSWSRRPRGLGRPTKAERRALSRLRGDLVDD